MLLALVAFVLLSACSSSNDPAPTPDDAREATKRELTYLRGRKLMRLDIATGSERMLGRVSSPDVHRIPGRPDRFLLVEDRGSGEDFAQDPVLSVVDEAGEEQTGIGPGFGPIVHSSGNRVAYLRSAGSRVCEGEVCLGSASLRVADVDGGSGRVLPPGDWHPLAWAGDDLIVSSAGTTQRVDLSGRSETLDVTPSEVWGVSPDGREIVLSSKARIALRSLDTGRVRELDAQGLLAEGEWSPSGDELVAVLVEGGRTRLVRISLHDATVAPIPDTEEALGPVLWASDGSFVYVRADGLMLEAVFCDEAVDCRPVLRWGEGVTPLTVS